MSPTVHLLAAARPNFMKIAPVYHAMNAADWCEPVIVHTGQHYDANMSDSFFEDLHLTLVEVADEAFISRVWAFEVRVGGG